MFFLPSLLEFTTIFSHGRSSHASSQTHFFVSVFLFLISTSQSLLLTLCSSLLPYFFSFILAANLIPNSSNNSPDSSYPIIFPIQLCTNVPFFLSFFLSFYFLFLASLFSVFLFPSPFLLFHTRHFLASFFSPLFYLSWEC